MKTNDDTGSGLPHDAAAPHSIHDFDFSLICEYFASFNRQGPGSPETTRRALGFIENLPANARIADVGCGTGGQTTVLAEELVRRFSRRHENSARGAAETTDSGTDSDTDATFSVTGIDLFPQFVELFNRNASERGVSAYVHGKIGSMDKLDFEPESLDLIWSEGAIYNIGFERGVNEWKRFLKPGGYLAVTEATWLTDERPAEIEAFWNNAYPEIGTIPQKIAQMQKAGYTPIAAFTLGSECWTDHFYAPAAAVQKTFLQKHADSPAARNLVAAQKHEQALYAKYCQYYGYVFYIGKKR
ncbi:class I SAM-dependent methyltransferase [Treponema brennaborense]|uniref:Methyltransferase type 11 n=1 Tax=Treponema brennaborense (strain DSM 12168 / CIP 105900 / DD5/3) TaxID=906968 RepID=F4LLC8_TREBD|nr:class I SAM-dependent methyltransferase [Treponema brennaborense]AEE15606.1 Methyltransferase type 11 [Treponema brennaborense DSM 12168]